MVLSPASLSAAGPLALPLFAPAAFVVFGVAVMDMMAPVLTGATVLIRLLSRSGPVPVSVAVVVPRLVRHRRRRVSGSHRCLWHAGLVMVVLVGSKQRPLARLNN